MEAYGNLSKISSITHGLVQIILLNQDSDILIQLMAVYLQGIKSNQETVQSKILCKQL